MIVHAMQVVFYDIDSLNANNPKSLFKSRTNAV